MTYLLGLFCMFVAFGNCGQDILDYYTDTHRSQHVSCLPRFLLFMCFFGSVSASACFDFVSVRIGFANLIVRDLKTRLENVF